MDLIYIQKTRSFFIYESTKNQIWKLSLIDLQHKLWLTGTHMVGYDGRTIEEAMNGKAMAVRVSHSSISVVEIQEDGSRGKIVTSKLEVNFLSQFKVGGLNGDILIAFDRNKKLLSCKIQNNLNLKILGELCISPLKNERDESDSIAISPCGKYVFMHTYSQSERATKQLIIHVDGGEMELYAVLDLSHEQFKYFYHSFAFLKAVENKLIFKCIVWSRTSATTVLTLIYDKVTREFNEIENHRLNIRDGVFSKLTRQGGMLYAIGFDTARLLTIT